MTSRFPSSPSTHDMWKKDMPLGYGHNINLRIRAMKIEQLEAAPLTQMWANDR